MTRVQRKQSPSFMRTSSSWTEKTWRNHFRQANVGGKVVDESVCAEETVHTLQSVIKKLKLGRSSCGGVTAEVWKALLGVALQSLAKDFTRRLRELDIPEDWTEVSACPILKDASTERVETVSSCQA